MTPVYIKNLSSSDRRIEKELLSKRYGMIRNEGKEKKGFRSMIYVPGFQCIVYIHDIDVKKPTNLQCYRFLLFVEMSIFAFF